MGFMAIVVILWKCATITQWSFNMFMHIVFNVSIYNLHIEVEQLDLMLEVAIKIVCFEKNWGHAYCETVLFFF